MPEFSQAEQEVIEDFRSLNKEQQEELVVNLGLQTVASTMELLGFREDEEEKPTAPAIFETTVRGRLHAHSKEHAKEILGEKFGRQHGGLEKGRVELLKDTEIQIDEAVLQEAKKHVKDNE